TLDPVSAANSAERGPRRGVVYAIAASFVRDGMVWCGTDDGLIWLTRDDGAHWENVTPRELAAWSKVGVIEPSHFDAETAYAAIDRHRLDDVDPHVLRTRDGGKSWTPIAAGIPSGSYVNVVREDPERAGLLYAGTETGVFVSFDAGDHWQSLQANLPNCSIRDIALRRGDVVLATHGRAFWVLDDAGPLRQLDAKSASADLWLFAPRAAVRLNPAPFQGTPDPKDEPLAANPPDGAVLDYVLKTAPATPLTIEILDARGAVVRRYASDDAEEAPDLQRLVTTPDWSPARRPPPASAGAHRFVWDLRYETPKALMSRRRREGGGLWAAPGTYTVRLTAGGRSVQQSLVVSRDPRIPATDEDLARQLELARKIQAERIRVAEAMRKADALRKQIARVSPSSGSGGPARDALSAFSRELEDAAGPAPDAGEFFDEHSVAPTNLRVIADGLARYERTVESADAAPTPDAEKALPQRRAEVEAGLARWGAFLNEKVPAVNGALRAAGLPALTLD
ncbi:MAG TPA: hypothetical protein VGH97_09020, partial [Thermoanaerobaculia bacterium]